MFFFREILFFINIETLQPSSKTADLYKEDEPESRFKEGIQIFIAICILLASIFGMIRLAVVCSRCQARNVSDVEAGRIDIAVDTTAAAAARCPTDGTVRHDNGSGSAEADFDPTPAVPLLMSEDPQTTTNSTSTSTLAPAPAQVDQRRSKTRHLRAFLRVSETAAMAVVENSEELLDA